MKMDLNSREWGEFFLKDVFSEIQRGKRLKKYDHLVGKIPYVSSTALNNGIDGFIGNKEKVRIYSDCLTIANSGSVGATFYQSCAFVASDHVTKLQNKKFNKYIYLFISLVSKRLSEKYSFNREINDKRIQREKIILPITPYNEPDYAFMEQYMRVKEQDKLEQYNKYIQKRLKECKDYKEVKSLKEKEWGEFFIENLFDTKIGKSIDGNKINKLTGRIAYITRKESNNGLDGFISFDKKLLNFEYPVITIGNETAEPFVQSYPFFTGTKVNILKPKEKISRYSLLFIAESIKKHKGKYSYSFTINSTRLKRQKILLPINTKNEPDYEYMENYIKKIEFEKLNQYLQMKTK